MRPTTRGSDGPVIDRAVAAHQRRGMVAKRIGEVMAERRIADQHVGHAGAFADFEDRNAETDEGRAVIHRLERHIGDAEGYQRRRVRVHDRDHIGALLVDLAVDVAFGEQGRHRQTVRIDRPAVEIEFNDVLAVTSSADIPRAMR